MSKHEDIVKKVVDELMANPPKPKRMAHHELDLEIGRAIARDLLGGILNSTGPGSPVLEPTMDVERLFDRKEMTVSVLKKFQRCLEKILENEILDMRELEEKAIRVAKDRDLMEKASNVEAR